MAIPPRELVGDLPMGYAAVIAATIAAVGSIVNTLIGLLLRRQIRTPSGGTLGEVVERSHHLSAVTTAGVRYLAKKANGDELPAELEEHR